MKPDRNPPRERASLATAGRLVGRAVLGRKLRFFGRLTVVEIASPLDVSQATIKRRWIFAKARLSMELEDGKIKWTTRDPSVKELRF